jgi:hypothetical protein
VTKFIQGLIHEIKAASLIGPSNSGIGAFVQKLRSAAPHEMSTMQIRGTKQLLSPVAKK